MSGISESMLAVGATAAFIKLKVTEMLKKAFAEHKGSELKILITGKTGQGKSTLINGILGAHVAPEGAGARRCTTEVAKYKKVIHEVPVTVFDSPGLQDRTANKDEYIRGMEKQCQNLSLILYCTKMTNTRLTDDDRNAMINLTEAFGEEFWDYAVIVLTFANQEDTSRQDERDEDFDEPSFADEQAWEELEKRRFQGRLKIWQEELHEFLIEEVQVSEKIATNIPVVPTGDRKATRKNPNYLKLPDRDNWFNDYWEVCCLRIKETFLFLKINQRRMIPKDDGATEEIPQELPKEFQTPSQASTHVTNNTLIDESITINQTFVEKITMQTVERSFGKDIADTIRAGLTLVAPVKWFFEVIKSLF